MQQKKLEKSAGSLCFQRQDRSKKLQPLIQYYFGLNNKCNNNVDLHDIKCEIN